MSDEFNILPVFAEDKALIAYRLRFAKLTGNVTGAILLQQMIYRFQQKNGEDFYKFKVPCGHKLYRAGDSWCEELCFTRREFDTALAVIGTKIASGVSKNALFAKNDVELPTRLPNEGEDAYITRLRELLRYVVIYWTDKHRVTWYHINSKLLNRILGFIYVSTNPPLHNVSTNPPLHISSKITSEITRTHTHSAPNGAGVRVSEKSKPKASASKGENTSVLDEASRQNLSQLLIAVKRHIFELDPAMEDERATDIAEWLNGTSEKPVQPIKSPAKSKYVRAFAEWCKEKDMILPLNLKPFMTQWRKWATEINANSNRAKPMSIYEVIDAEAREKAKQSALSNSST